MNEFSWVQCLSEDLWIKESGDLLSTYLNYCVGHGITAYQFSSVQSLSRVWLFETPWTVACQASLSITNSQSLLKLMPIELVMPSSHLFLCRPLLLLLPIPFSIRVFSNGSTLRTSWPKYWNFSFSISPSNERPGLISFRRDWLDLLAVQGTLQSSPTPQFKSINFSALLIDTPILKMGDFSGGPVAKTPSFQCKKPGFNPWSGN